MNFQQTMTALKRLGTEQTRKTWRRHGATGEYFGVNIGDMKVLLKQVRGQQALALELYASGNLDAMYFAGLVADGAAMSKKELERWAKEARWGMISEYTVPWVASESAHAHELALKWIDAKSELVASAGWNTYAALVALEPDAELDLEEIEELLARVEKQIEKAPNRVRYCMNGFVIAVGCYVKPLVAKARASAKRISGVEVDMGDTECKLPSALERIAKVEAAGKLGAKRKTVKC